MQQFLHNHHRSGLLVFDVRSPNTQNNGRNGASQVQKADDETFRHKLVSGLGIEELDLSVATGLIPEEIK